MTKQEFIGASGILLPGAITIPKGGEIAISQDWLIFPDAITGEGKVWTIDGLLEPCIKPDNEVWVDSNVENPFAGPITYKGKNKYGWQVGEIPEDVTNELDFINRKSVHNIILSNQVTEIPDKAFYECYDLQNIIISNSVQRIGNVAFYHCYNLQTLTIPDTVVEMGGGVFYDCYNLKYIKLPNTLTHLDHYLYTSEEGDQSQDMGFFQNCHNLQTIVLPQTLQSIGNSAFSACFSLTSVTIPNSVTSIGEHAFYGCQNLTSIVIPDNVTNIENSTFYNCYNLTSINIPNSVTSIGSEAFTGCSSLTSITIPNNVTSIGDYAFSHCSKLTYMIIGESVTSIGYNTFFGTTLERIVSYAETPPIIEQGTFESVDKSIPLEVPNADLYREAPYWQEFYNIYNINPYQLNVSSNNEEWGYVRILEHNTNRSIIEAYDEDGYVFKQWSDGNTDIWRELNITEDTTLVAEFEKVYIPSITRMDIISTTPTSITIEFEVVCDEERQYFHDGYISYYTDQDQNSIPTSREFGVQEINIDGLNPNTDYAIVLHIKNNANDVFFIELNFTTPSLPYTYVDLGLPSGTLWADKNVGAKNQWDNGLYFSWGNVDGHAVDENDNVIDGYSFDGNTYSTSLGGQYTGSTLDAEYDAATVNMGSDWRMPTVDETLELVQNTDHYYIDEDGNKLTESELDGYELRSICFVKQGEEFDYNDRSNFIEFPFAGFCSSSLLANERWLCFVWSSSVHGDGAQGAYILSFSSGGGLDGASSSDRYYGFPVRGVKNN